MYSKSAEFYDSLYSLKDYRGAAESLHAIVKAHCPHATSLLDVACGTGRHLAYFRNWFEVQGLDLNENLLQVAAGRCPGVLLHRADMTDFSLHQRFDVVTCLFSSIAYVVTREKLISAVQCMAQHLTQQGLLLIEPFFTPEQYVAGSMTLNTTVTASEKIAWMYVTKRQGSVAVADIHFMVGDRQGVEYFVERHEMGLYSAEDWDEAFSRAGLQWESGSAGPFGRGLYIAYPKEPRILEP